MEVNSGNITDVWRERLPELASGGTEGSARQEKKEQKQQKKERNRVERKERKASPGISEHLPGLTAG